MRLFVKLFCDIQPSTNVTKNSILGIAKVLDLPLELYNMFQNLCRCSNRTIVITLSVSEFLSSYRIFDNWKYRKTSISPQLKYSTFVSITPHFLHLHHSVTLWFFFFLNFSCVLGISYSSAKQTLFTSKLTGSYSNTTKAILLKHVMRFTIWDHLYNLKNVKNTHRGLLILLKLQALKLTLLHGCFSHFLNCTNGTKSCNAPHIVMKDLNLWQTLTEVLLKLIN